MFANGKLQMSYSDESIVKSELKYMLATGGHGGGGSLTVRAQLSKSKNLLSYKRDKFIITKRVAYEKNRYGV